MKLNTNIWISAALTAAQVVAQLSGMLPGKLAFVGLGAQLAAEFLLKIKAAYSNTDGSPQAVPFRANKSDQLAATIGAVETGSAK